MVKALCPLSIHSFFPCSRAFLQRVKDLSEEVKEFVGTENAKVVPLSAHTGYGLDNLRASLAAALGRIPPPSEPLASVGPPKRSSIFDSPETADGARLGTPESRLVVSEPAEAVDADEEVIPEAPEGAATGTVLDYTSSAKTGRLLVSAIT